ncbi:MAG TPA: hypothetical protein VFE46_03665 [Pirellulales bacterium]|jgi:hypothetical protein|nr:hypothetical protein [Pirellulales bacterium]
MKKFRTRLLPALIGGLILFFLMQQRVLAQRRGQGGLRAGEATPSQLLQIEAVQKELKLTDEQKSQATKVNESLTSGRRQIFSENAKDSKERQPKLAELNKKLDAEVEQMLDDSQKKRLKEILLQVNGGAELQKEEIQKALNLTDDQKTKLAEVQKENTKARRDALAQVEGSARTTKEAELYREGNQKLLSVLTPAQNKQFEQMQGEKIDVDLTQPAPAGGKSGGKGKSADGAKGKSGDGTKSPDGAKPADGG